MLTQLPLRLISYSIQSLDELFVNDAWKSCELRFS